MVDNIKNMATDKTALIQLFQENVYAVFTKDSVYQLIFLIIYLANVIIDIIPKTSSSPMNTTWMAAKITSIRKTYVCHSMRYKAPTTAGILSTIDTNTPTILSVRLPFRAKIEK